MKVSIWTSGSGPIEISGKGLLPEHMQEGFPPFSAYFSLILSACVVQAISCDPSNGVFGHCHQAPL